ncbi:HAD family hydrolase [Treponema sp. R80B11-R83G3]
MHNLKNNNPSNKIELLPKGAIFDMDGTLLDSERIHIKFIIEACQQMKQPIEESFLFTRIGIPEVDNRKAYFNKYGIDFPFDKIFKIVVEKENELANKSGFPLRPGVLSILNKFKHLNIPLAVATSATTQRAKDKLSKSGILEYFSVFACADELKNGKPAPDIFLLAVKKMELEVKDCIGFEDSPAGLQGLHSAGIRSIFVKDLLMPSNEILQDVWYSCSSMDEAAELF